MTNLQASILKKIAAGGATVGVIGLGYVGIPLALSVAQSGLKVIGFDVLPDRVAHLEAGVSPLVHIPDADIATMKGQGFSATLDFNRTTECDALIICVPTLLDEHREPDLSYVIQIMTTLKPLLREGQTLSLESTTWPGTTEELLRPVIEDAGLTIGENFFLLYSPERESPGQQGFSIATIPKVVGGSTPACLKVGMALYGTFIHHVVEVSDTRTAEMVKLFENIQRAVNIGLVNEMKIAADTMGIDIFEVVDAAKTKPFGFTPYYPGPGIGGHCIPIDPYYLTWKVREYGLQTRFIELAGDVNEAMPDYVIKGLLKALNAKGKALNNAKVLALGLAYKPNVDDLRESPSIDFMEGLLEWGADVSYSDPHVPHFKPREGHPFDLKSVNLTPETLSGFDAVVLLTDHKAFDYDMIERHAPLLLDTRGRFRHVEREVWRA